MSGNVKFNTLVPKPTKKIDEKPRVILPHDFLVSLQGRRVIVFLSYKGHEVEGRLAAVDAERGDVFLEDVVHYSWGCNAAGKPMKDRTREELQRSDSAMMNSRYIEMIALA